MTDKTIVSHFRMLERRYVKDELDDTSLHVRVDKFFHHIHLQFHRMKVNLPQRMSKVSSTMSTLLMPEIFMQTVQNTQVNFAKSRGEKF